MTRACSALSSSLTTSQTRNRHRKLIFTHSFYGDLYSVLEIPNLKLESSMMSFKTVFKTLSQQVIKISKETSVN
jgi:hypothetical protein